MSIAERELVVMTVAQVAERLQLSRSAVYELMQSGRMRFHKIGRARRVPVSEVNRLLAETLVGQ